MKRHQRYLSAAATLSIMLGAGPILYPINAVSSHPEWAAQSKSLSTGSSYAPISSGTYAVDVQHSSINFSIQHLLINNVRGRFADYTATITYNADDMTKSSVEFTAKVASVDTDVAKRDEHLRTADFFDVATYPEMTFKSTRLERNGREAFVAHGDFTLRGVRKHLAIPFTVVGAVPYPMGRHPNRRRSRDHDQPSGLRREVQSADGERRTDDCQRRADRTPARGRQAAAGEDAGEKVTA